MIEVTVINCTRRDATHSALNIGKMARPLGENGPAHQADAMTSDEFRLLVAANDDATLLGPCLRDDLVPYVCDPVPGTWDMFRGDLVAALGVAGENITVV